MLRKYKIFLISLLFTNTAIGADMVNINFKEFKLDNGLRLLVHEDHKAPIVAVNLWYHVCLLYTSPSPRDQRGSRMPSSA